MDYLRLGGGGHRLSLFGSHSGVLIGKGDLLFLEHVLANNQNWSSTVELGTKVGLTSLYLGMAMHLRSGRFYTFDIVDCRNVAVKTAWLENMEFIQGDILSSPHERVISVMSQPNTLTFVDNGNKIKEVNTYAKHIAVGSGFVVHDWDTEIRIGNIDESLNLYGFKEEYNEIAMRLYSSCRYFHRS